MSHPSQQGIALATQALIKRMEVIGASTFSNEDCSLLVQYIIAHYLMGEHAESAEGLR